MPVAFLLLYIMGAVCLLGAALKVQSGPVELGWLGLLFWLVVTLLRASGLS